MKVPKIVQETAQELGFNCVNYVGKYEDYNVYGCSCMGNNGIPEPVGLPTLILQKEEHIKIVDGFDALHLAVRFDKS